MLTVKVATLREALALVAPAVPSKPSLEILHNVRLGEGKLEATDLDKTITISGVGVDGESSVLLNFRTLKELLATIPGEGMLRITPASGKKHEATLLAGPTQVVMASPDPADYPKTINFQVEHEAAVADGDTFVGDMAFVLPYAGRDDQRPVLNALCLNLGTPTEVAAADGCRLSWRELPFTIPGEGSLVVPSRTVDALVSLWKKAPIAPDFQGSEDIAQIAVAKRPIRLAWDKHHLAMTWGRVSLVTQLVDGRFPNYRQLIPAGGHIHVGFYGPELVRAVKSVLPMVDNNKVLLSWTEKELTVEGRGDVARASTTIQATASAEGSIAFNTRYLLDLLDSWVDFVVMQVTNFREPALFSYHDIPQVVLMPIFSEDAAKKAEKKAEPPKPEQTEGQTEEETEEHTQEPAAEEVQEAVTEPEEAVAGTPEDAERPYEAPASENPPEKPPKKPRKPRAKK